MNFNKNNAFSVAKRVIPANAHALHRGLQNFVSDIEIQAFYNADVHTKYDHRTLLYVLTVDGLFLLALLHIDAIAVRSNNYYFLTGKQGMPLVNAAGVEVTMDGIVRDVFMLENQIPIHELKKISQVDVNSMGIQQENSLGQTMIDFCRPLSPLVHLEQLPGSEAEERYHLLDLMYHWIVQEPVPESLPVPEKVILQLLLRPLLAKAIPWAVDSIFGNPENMPSFNQTLISVIEVKLSFLKLGFHHRDSASSSDEAVTIPSASKLRNVNINFKPAEGGISSVRYDEEMDKFYLPRIRLDAISEVIITNLVAYESLTKPHLDLIFTRYIDLMSALIVTSEDAKLLVRKHIIETQLRDEVVVQLFNGMTSKSIGSWPSTDPLLLTRIEKLEAEVAKVNSRFISVRTLDWFKVKYKRIFVLILIAVVLSPTVKDVFVGIYCLTLFRNIYPGVCYFHEIEDHGRNISLTSSM